MTTVVLIAADRSRHPVPLNVAAFTQCELLRRVFGEVENAVVEDGRTERELQLVGIKRGLCVKRCFEHLRLHSTASSSNVKQEGKGAYSPRGCTSTTNYLPPAMSHFAVEVQDMLRDIVAEDGHFGGLVDLMEAEDYLGAEKLAFETSKFAALLLQTRLRTSAGAALFPLSSLKPSVGEDSSSIGATPTDPFSNVSPKLLALILRHFACGSVSQIYQIVEKLPSMAAGAAECDVLWKPGFLLHATVDLYALMESTANRTVMNLVSKRVACRPMHPLLVDASAIEASSQEGKREWVSSMLQRQTFLMNAMHVTIKIDLRNEWLLRRLLGCFVALRSLSLQSTSITESLEGSVSSFSSYSPDRSSNAGSSSPTIRRVQSSQATLPQPLVEVDLFPLQTLELNDVTIPRNYKFPDSIRVLSWRGCNIATTNAVGNFFSTSASAGGEKEAVAGPKPKFPQMLQKLHIHISEETKFLQGMSNLAECKALNEVRITSDVDDDVTYDAFVEVVKKSVPQPPSAGGVAVRVVVVPRKVISREDMSMM